MVALRSLALAALALSSPLLVAADDGEWIEFYDKASNKKAYYHSVTRQSAWEAPEGAKVKYMTAEDTSSAGVATKVMTYNATIDVCEERARSGSTRCSGWRSYHTTVSRRRW